MVNGVSGGGTAGGRDIYCYLLMVTDIRAIVNKSPLTQNKPTIIEVSLVSSLVYLV